MDVFEHLYQPGRAAVRLAELNSPGGAGAIASPDYDSWLRRFLGRKSVSFEVPEHVAYYTSGTLRRTVGGCFDLVHAHSIGQFRTPEFLADRLDAVLPFGWRVLSLLEAVHGSGWLPCVPSGSLLAILCRKSTG